MARGSELRARGPDGWHADRSWGPAEVEKGLHVKQQLALQKISMAPVQKTIRDLLVQEKKSDPVRGPSSDSGGGAGFLGSQGSSGGRRGGLGIFMHSGVMSPTQNSRESSAKVSADDPEFAQHSEEVRVDEAQVDPTYQAPASQDSGQAPSTGARPATESGSAGGELLNALGWKG